MVNTQHILAMYGLRWNPFLPDVPPEALYKTKLVEDFCWRAEHIVLDGGFALITGNPGVGKSAAVRIVAEHLSAIPELSVKPLTLVKCGLRDFYRELAQLYEIDVAVSNRYGNFNKLRERWIAQIRNKYFRPVLIIDEAQEMMPDVLLELRILGSTNFDSRCILGTILAGDQRLTEKLGTPALLPLLSRVRAHLLVEEATSTDLAEILRNALEQAGAPDLVTPGLRKALVDNCMGNPRAMMNMANELLGIAAKRGDKQLTEEVFFELHKHATKRKR
jgi:type II secretory pathway predicted ATPase ExeA